MLEIGPRELDAIHRLPYWRVSLQDHIVDKILGRKRIGGNDIRILDLGCGLGYTLARLSQLLSGESEVIGIEVEPRNIKKARAIVREFGDSSRAKIHRTNAERMFFSEDYFDIVIANLSFSVFKNAGAATSEVARVLKPEGHVIVSEVSNCSFLGKMGILLDALTHHLYYRLYSPNSLAGLFTSRGFRVENVSRIPLMINTRNRLLRIPSAISPVFSIEFLKPCSL